MDIRKRIEAAEALWRSGQREDAWISAMIATAATARKRYPRPLSDNVSFKNFIRDITYTIYGGKLLPADPPTKVNIMMGNRPFEDILYEDYRCSWVHEAGLDPNKSELSKSEAKEGQIIQTLVVGKKTALPDNWVWNLILAIKNAPENLDEFRGRSKPQH